MQINHSGFLHLSASVAGSRIEGAIGSSFFGSLNHLWSALADEDRFVAPLHHEVLSDAHWAQVHFNDTSSKHVLGWPECVHQLAGHRADERSGDKASRDCEEVDPWPSVCMPDGQAIGTEIQCALWDSCRWLRRVFSKTNWSE